MVAPRPSEDGKLRLAARGKRFVDASDLLRAQLQPLGARVLLDVRAARGLGNGEGAREPGEEASATCRGVLRWARAIEVSTFGERA